ncbi:Glucose dehydrogenase [Eumeta japonica]|uniref:Glucose dehydrogenase n=1 Tax=Eumeta variegata TaxID=151549 RepID=A0A4C1Y8A5_EUMVA|nr:Glucose dehydrogenase [Eumeta japonica]
MDAAAVPSNLTDIAAINGTLQALLATIMVNMITVNYPPSAEVPDKAEYDVIIVGAGSAGSALARRLADSGCFNVLLVEAGGDPEIQPPGLFILFTGGAQDWDYHAENNGWACQAQNNAQIGHTRGKMLGGCSCLDHLIFIRGSSKIFDDWEKMGNEGWNWENCFEYFKRIEDIKDPKILNSDTLKYHGQSGPMVLTPTTNKNFSEKGRFHVEML